MADITNPVISTGVHQRMGNHDYPVHMIRHHHEFIDDYVITHIFRGRPFILDNSPNTVVIEQHLFIMRAHRDKIRAAIGVIVMGQPDGPAVMDTRIELIITNMIHNLSHS